MPFVRQNSKKTYFCLKNEKYGLNGKIPLYNFPYYLKFIKFQPPHDKPALRVSARLIFQNHGFELSTLRIKVLHNNKSVLDVLSISPCMVMNP